MYKEKSIRKYIPSDTCGRHSVNGSPVVPGRQLHIGM